MNTLKTNITSYSFDIREPDEKAQYDAILEKLKGRECFNVWGGSKRLHIGSGPVLLETKCLFNNQWNTSEDSPTAPNARVFDWYEEYPVLTPKHRKNGHYLDITPEMEEIRRNTTQCGYCGAYYQAAQGYVFCDKCLDSPYLEEKDLKLLRLYPVSEKSRAKYPELSAAEKAHIMPQYISRQTTGKDSRNAKRLAEKRARIESGYKKSVYAAKTEHDGFIWLMDNQVNIENCIYYSHTDIFSFGWRSPVSPEVKSKLLDVLTEFPHNYEIK